VIFKFRNLAAFAAVLMMAAPAIAQEGKWASAADSTANRLIDLERQWAEEACTGNGITQAILAEDFQGTAPDGSRYSKAQEVAHEKPSEVMAKDCRLINARVHFFGENVALVYGSESSVRKSPDGSDSKRCLVWTDTWLERNASWQIVAAQDTQVDCK
jgi:Domain of unknown function (DUF4440)